MAKSVGTGGITRRTALAGGAGIALALPALDPALAAPDDMAAAIKEAFGGADIRPGGVTVEIPPLSESGHLVPLTVTVDSPMTDDDHVTGIFVFSEKNPSANVVRFHLGPHSGRARVQTYIRLADTQDVTVIARMKDGTCRSGKARTLVTIAACLEDS